MSKNILVFAFLACTFIGCAEAQVADSEFICEYDSGKDKLTHPELCIERSILNCPPTQYGNYDDICVGEILLQCLRINNNPYEWTDFSFDSHSERCYLYAYDNCDDHILVADRQGCYGRALWNCILNW